MPDLIAEITATLDRMIAHQRSRAHAAAQRVEPAITPDDIAQPQDFPAVYADPHFNWEDGQTAGLLSARIAVVARLREMTGHCGDGP
ncbi:MAG: hypothetical protein JXA57_09525 [Armatimonadetes bacterium]|nr:hypothetical protein [Armatimonadota bacterium]